MCACETVHVCMQEREEKGDGAVEGVRKETN